ncbi:molybdate ABC transporter substrate-binding protein [Neobacillus kokaensis]|uniref:ABC transporter substrate-binding lipoprotein YvgL n=1 Tax=Neobacillus kokaensis TaxID=2759023 RepID=A0ABQ3N1Y7_9BACI|nr:molybdate ABC transporter substrate-binding protein [Neobacillus kokaensis]GHH98104.1 putative ABC transporter substrate-binding lipoprotein YvgL [Neobacillus kokaensis]
MKKQSLLFCSILLLFLFTTGCSSKDSGKKKVTTEKKVELTVSAAASLQDALNDIQANFEKEYTNVKINYNFGASGALQQQISQGAPVDLYFSATEDKFDQLVTDGLIERKNGTDLVGNKLVLVVPKGTNKNIQSFKDLRKADKISIGTPESVPAGKYAKDTLEHLHIWKVVEDKVVFAKDVRQVLTYVETNNVDAGIVYKTDAMISPKVQIVASAEENTHAPIIYPVGIIKTSTHPKETMAFFEYLQSQKAIDIFEKYGFKGLH